MIITISTYDDLYFSQLKSFLTSLSVNSPDDIIKVSLIDYPEDVTNELRNKFDRYIFENRSVECVDERGIHFILMRVDLILECFERKQPAAWIDTDVVVRGDLKPFLDIEHDQLKILYRGDHVPEESRFNAGIMNVGYSLKTHAFIKRWRERLSINMVWGMGQLELYNSYVEHRSNIELVKMPKSFNDLGDSTNSNSFNDDSLMWHSKLKHFNNPKFQNEFQKYLNLYLTK